MKLNFKKTGSGEPLFILHGLFGSADNWLGIARGLEKDFTIFLIDLRNHGDSPKSDTWDYKSMAMDLEELVKGEGLEKVHLLGHSMGGKVSMAFALLHPDMVNRLVVVDIAPRYYPVHHQSILEGLNAIPLEKIKSRNGADEILAQYIEEKAIRQFLLKSLGRDEEGRFIWKINLPVITENIENIGEALEPEKGIETPTLFVRGENSNYVQEKDRKEMDRIFPNNHLVTIKNAGHWIHAEQPEAVVKTVKAFLYEN